MAEVQAGQRKERFQPRIITVTVEGEDPRRVYEVAPGRYQTREQLADRVTRMDQVIAEAEAAKAEPDIELLREQFVRRQDRRIEMAGRVKQAVGQVIADLEG